MHKWQSALANRDRSVLEDRLDIKGFRLEKKRSTPRIVSGACFQEVDLEDSIVRPSRY